MTMTLGAAPQPLSVLLTQGADFVSGLDSQDGAWPVGAVISLVFNDPAATTWAATITGASADWNVDKATVDTLIAALPQHGKVRLTYTDGPVDLLWAAGNVVRRVFA